MPPTIRKGSTGPDVTYCQTLLCQKSFPTGVDGVFGSDTERQVKAFQSSRYLVDDGIVGPATWTALEASETVVTTMDKVASLLHQLKPQKYLLSGAQCPSNPPGISLRNIGDSTTNCCTMTGWLLGWAFPGVSFTSKQWSLWMVSTTDSGNVPTLPNWGPRVALEWGAATTAPGDGPCLIQYFTDSGGGHSLIVLDYDPDTDKILTLEANNAYGLDGAGWGDIGNLRDVFNPGPDWMDSVSQTWTGRIQSKAAVHVARLNLTGVREWLAKA